MAPGGTAADSWGPWIGPRYGSSSGAAAEPRRGARLGHGGSHARVEGARYAGPNLGGCTRTRRHSGASGAAATARNLGAVESPAAGAAAPRVRSVAVERQQRGSSPSAAAAAPGRGANLGRGGGHQRRKPRARWSGRGHRGTAAEARARGAHQRRGGGARARQPKLGRSGGTGARQPSLGPVARISGAVERQQRHQGAAAEARARGAHRGAAAEPRAR